MQIIQNFKTRRLKLRRIDVIDILLLLDEHFEDGEKWRKLHDDIRRQFDEQEKNDADAL